jgi:hypothetical protein
MTEGAAGRWPAPLPISNAEAAVAAPRVCQGAHIFEVVVACAQCGVRQTFCGTVPEIGDAAEVWQRGHHCAGRLGQSGSAALANGKPGRPPGIGSRTAVGISQMPVSRWVMIASDLPGRVAEDG